MGAGVEEPDAGRDTMGAGVEEPGIGRGAGREGKLNVGGAMNGAGEGPPIVPDVGVEDAKLAGKSRGRRRGGEV